MTDVANRARDGWWPGVWTWLAVGALGLVAAASAGLAGLMAVIGAAVSLELADQGHQLLDDCARPLTGLRLAWARWSWLGLAGLAVAVAFAAAGVAYSVGVRRRLVAASLTVVVLGLSPIPWVLQYDAQRGDRYDVDCRPLGP